MTNHGDFSPAARTDAQRKERAASVFAEVWLLSEQSSKAGSGSLMTVPTPLESGDART